MAETNVPITAGSGTPIDVFSQANASLRQAVVLGDATAAYTALVDAAGRQAVLQPDAQATGNITATDAVVGGAPGNGALLTGASTANSYVSLSVPGGQSDSVFQLTGTFGSGTVYFEQSVDSTDGLNGNWTDNNCRQTGVINTVLSNGTTTAGYFRGNLGGAKWLRARMVGATAPNVAVILRASAGMGPTFLNASIPGGSNNIGSVALRDGASVALTSTLTNARQALDVNLASTAGAMPVAAGTLSATVAQSTGGTATTTAMVVAPVAAAGNATITVNTSAFVGTLAFEASDDAGVTYYSVVVVREDGSGADTTFAISTAALLARMWTLGLPGITHFRVRCSAFTSGTAAIRISPGPFLIEPSPSLGGSSAQIGNVKQAVSSTGTITSSASATTTAVLLAANTARLAAAIFNDSTAVLYVAFAATTTLTAYTVQIAAGGYYELPPGITYTGVISGLWAAANGFARVTEMT